MARTLALEWDNQEARYVVANTRGAQLVIEAAGALSVPAGDGANSRLRFGPALQAEFAAKKVGRIRTLVAIDRSQVDLLDLSLPPSSDAELPELVRHQAARESNLVTDDTRLDFIPLTDDPAEPRRVAAVVLTRDRLEQVQTICGEAGVTADAILLRPYAAAALFTSSLPDHKQASLLINVFADEIDLSVVLADKVVFWRTVRQSNVSQDPVAAKKLIAEINRTMVVVAHQLEGPIEAAFLFGGIDEHPALLEQLRTDFSGDVTLIDPFADVTEATGELPENAGRYSALLGMLTVEARRGAHAIDFLHPRKTPEPPDRRRTTILAGSAGTLLLLLLGYSVWNTLAEVDAQNAILSEELDRLDDQFKQAGKRQKVVDAIRDWGESDVNWLDEMRDLSLKFPSSRDVVLLRMGMNHARNVGGSIDMVGVVRDPAIVSRLETSLRDKYHQISSRHVQERDQDKSYAWHFEAQLVVTPRESKHYVSHLPEKPVEEPADSKKPVSKSTLPPQTTATER